MQLDDIDVDKKATVEHFQKSALVRASKRNDSPQDRDPDCKRGWIERPSYDDVSFIIMIQQLDDHVEEKV